MGTKRDSDSANGGTAPSRRGKKAVTVYFEPEIVRQLKRVGIEADKSIQAMMSEAVTQYLKKHGKLARER
ncbi:ribbon-helix-helix domain-containing protein [Hyphomonas sp. UBA3201]|uniref:ribbon-helix-helix domain-containing protein n=1 Tax=Hyphomonas sp. UBA3201 TaxID=1946623 RepID=UPI0025C51C30|nr:ribbon-helix-helix domain-containing protein [Hyphomonas sp. UBA3201]